ncbi:MAG: hypothetical protein M3P18_15050 [Actinomycetota bacterium]|nr:hypothetical protein [Actinomycetota bacterium]
MRKVSLRTTSLFTAISVIYSVYSMCGAAVVSASVAKDAEEFWPVTFEFDGPQAYQAERDLLKWATSRIHVVRGRGQDARSLADW